MLSLFMDPAVLCLLLYVITKGQAEADFGRVFFVCLGIGLGSAAIALALGPMIGFFALVPVLALGVFLLMRFCYTSLPQSIGVLAAFALFKIVIGFVF
jgi:hypothetical protein